MNLKLGKYRLIKESEILILETQNVNYKKLLNDSDKQMKQLKYDIKVLQQLLDISEQQVNILK